MMFRIGWITALALLACNGDTDTDSDTDTDTTSELVSVTVSSTLTELTTRETVGFTVTGEYDDGETQDVTADCLFDTDVEGVLLIVGTVGQPVDGGAVAVKAECFDNAFTAGVTLNISVAKPQAGDLVFNEILADGTVDGDPNGDGSANSKEDEFVELANLSDVTVDLSGVKLFEQDFAFLPRHTFADGTSLKAGSAIVVFGGGDVSTLTADYVQFVIAQNEDPGEDYGLALTDTGDSLVLMPAEDGPPLAQLSYGSESTDNPAPSDASLTLSPDVTGTVYKVHTDAEDASGAYSPGTFSNGTPFVGPFARYASSD